MRKNSSVRLNKMMNPSKTITVIKPYEKPLEKDDDISFMFNSKMTLTKGIAGDPDFTRAETCDISQLLKQHNDLAFSAGLRPQKLETRMRAATDGHSEMSVTPTLDLRNRSYTQIGKSRTVTFKKDR